MYDRSYIVQANGETMRRNREALWPKHGSANNHTVERTESSEMENATLTVPEATPGIIAAGGNTILVKQASVSGTSPNKETTHLKIRGSQKSNQSEVKTTRTRTRTIRAPKRFLDYV